MIDENPYAVQEAGAAHDVVVTDQVVELLPEPVMQGIGRGLGWIGAGFSDFKNGPWLFIPFLLLLFFASVVVSFGTSLASLFDPAFGMIVNVGGSLATNLLMILATAGFLTAVRRGRARGAIRFEDFFAGFSHPRLGSLVGILGVYALLGLVMMLVLLGAFLAVFGADDLTRTIAVFTDPTTIALGLGPSWMTDPEALDPTIFMVVGVVGGTVGVVVAMLFFFATHLVTFTELGVFEALKWSFVGCLKNVLPLTLWSVAAVLLVFAGAMLCGLGLFVAIPVLWASTYQAFLDIYTTEGAEG